MSNRLTQKDIDEIAGGLDRLAQLNEKVLKETTDAAEARGLQAFIQTKMTEHAMEFVACWITMQNEYLPLVKGFTALFGNACTMIDRQQKARAPKTCECAPGGESECREKCGDGCECKTTK